MSWEILVGDCREQMKLLPDNSVDAIVTDPPYELGFMGRKWDSSGIAYDLSVWTEALRVLKPGGHLLAFGGTRTYHRIAVAIEDAGFDIRDCLSWLYGSGMPKSHNISKAIDKKLGGKPKVVGKDKNFGASSKAEGKVAFGDYAGEWDITEPDTPEAKQWEGWGTGLKPAWEPIIMARKPVEGSTTENVLTHGTGAINILDTRIPTNGEVNPTTQRRQTPNPGLSTEKAAESAAKGQMRNRSSLEAYRTPIIGEDTGRWPANVLLGHSPGCVQIGEREVPGKIMNRFTSGAHPFGGAAGEEYESTDTGPETVAVWECEPDCPVRIMDEQYGRVTNSKRTHMGSRDGGIIYGGGKGASGPASVRGHNDSGGASRFFLQIPPDDAPGGDSGIGMEQVVLARKPFTGTVAENVLEFGTGAINIDATRVGDSGGTQGINFDGPRGQGVYGGGDGSYKCDIGELPGKGRWPANVILDEDAAEAVDAMSGPRRAGGKVKGTEPSNTGDQGVYGHYNRVENHPYNDEGGASRFFKTIEAEKPRGKRPGGFGNVGADKGDPVPNGPTYADEGGASRFFYVAKASVSEREAGLENLNKQENENWPQSLDGNDKRKAKPRANNHPTVKPIALMRYLCRMITPPGGVVLDPFMGSGSTGCAAVLEGFHFIGIDLTPEYAEIARARIAHWEPKPEPELPLFALLQGGSSE